MPRFLFKPSLMKPMWLDYGGYSAPGLMRHGHKWSDPERRHLYAGYIYEGKPLSYLACRHERGEASIAAQLNRIMQSPELISQLTQQLYQHKELTMNNLTSPKDVTLQPGEQITIKTVPAPGAASPAAQSASSGLLKDAFSNSWINQNFAEIFPGELTKLRGILDVATTAEAYRKSSRPNASIIHAFADGKVVQFGVPGRSWEDYTERSTVALGSPRYEWQVKPDVVVQKVGATLSEFKQLIFHFGKEGFDNLELTFEAGKLVGAKVI